MLQEDFMAFVTKIEEQTASALAYLLDEAKLSESEIVVVGCSTSEVIGKKIGTASSDKAAEAIFQGVYPTLNQYGLYLALQCCEHLNRALVVEKTCQIKYALEEVTVIPKPGAGGSLPRIGYDNMKHPVVVEGIQAHAGLEIGDTLIGMHLKPVAVPVRAPINTIGKAHLVMARTRPKLIGGERAIYKL